MDYAIAKNAVLKTIQDGALAGYGNESVFAETPTAIQRDADALLFRPPATPLQNKSLSLGIDVEAAVNGVQSELQPVGDAELVEDVVEVILDGLLADEHLF
ncbi:MAG TPA: hypothetical protein VN610_09600, partial [Bryobacteraceae bacterium]|nr:hypothetical protein [Bryobacteraceae bacterium]